MGNTQQITKIVPVLFGFYIMGFCDVVGIATSYIQADFQLSETLAGFIPSMVFCWFLLFSIPTALLMSRFGRKNMVLVGNVVTIIGMLIPFVAYSFTTCMVAFLLLGIGNTILQVSLNPLLTNVVKGSALTSSLTAGQVIKAVSSFCGPFIAAFAVAWFGNWKYLFPVFAGITFISTLWLLLTPLTEEKSIAKVATLPETFGLLKNKTILLLFLGIIFIVGVDVGMNTVTPKLLMERCGMPVESAGYGSSIYFFCRTVGAFVGAVLLARIPEIRYYRFNIGIALLAMAALFFASSQVSILVLVGIIGFTCSSIFPIIYSLAMKTAPEKANEISGLMITGVCGGAVVPPLMGLLTDMIGNQTGSLLVITLSIAYLIFCALKISSKNVTC
ncbi:MAG: MFS transporter [Tannerellaceae bacterium]|nr:MFS transporter [Tannerellaceae bacterium]